MSRKTWTLILCCAAQFMVILDVSIVNVALPSIRRDLGFSAVDLQWVVNAYTLTFAGFLLLGGRASDLLGRRRVFVFGLLLFAGASLVGGLSTTQGMLIGARGLQGLGGAVVAPATLSILTTTFAEGAERNRALSAWGAMGGAGGAAGALLGGLLTQALGWQWILFVNVPIGVAAALAAQRFVDEGRPDVVGRRHFDLAGAITVTAGLVVLTYGIVRTDVNGWGSFTTLATLAAGLALLGVFLVIEGRLSARPLVPLRIFRSRTLSGANVVVFMLGASVFAMWYFVSLYLQQVLGYSPIEAGLAGGRGNTSRQVGGSLGLAILATLATQRTNELGAGPAALTAGFHRAFEVGALFALAGAIAALVIIRRARPRAQPAPEPAPG